MSEPNPALEGIAIVGLAGRFPGARNVALFWRNLLAGDETITTLRDEQLRAAGVKVEEVSDDEAYVRRRGLLERPDYFDAAFFGISPREAEVMDPQQRIFLEDCWNALEDAGCDPARYAGAIGVFAGMSNNTYWANNVAHHPELIESVGWLTAMMGNEKDYLATRVAYKLNLRGPAISIYTACSTSLVAVCQAVQALQSYACDAALAGGVSATFPHERGYRYDDGGILSPDGHCRAFDEQAAGTVFSNGSGVVVLKRLADAVQAGDQIYAVIKGAALNNDGSGKVSFTAPSVAGHAEVIALAHALAGVSPRSIGYVEAHGTATPLGDPIEIAGLTQAFRTGTEDTGFCALGSVKTNIGHLDAAAGIAGLIKTVLCLRHGKIPPSLHFTTANPKLGLEGSPFRVVTKVTDWPAGETPRRAGVSSFGVGGTNAHCVLEAWTDTRAETPAGERPRLFPLSAKTPEALAQSAENLALFLEESPESNLDDLARTLQIGRGQFPHRLAMVAPSREVAISALRGFEPKRSFQQTAGAPRVVFMFPGQGSQYLGMGAQLAASEPVFREALNRCCELLRGLLGVDLRDVLYAQDQPGARELLRETRLTQPAIFSVSYALAKLWRSWGIEPAALIGHSVGEYVAAVLAGVFSLEDGLGLVAARARLVQEQPRGVMLAVRLSESDAAKYVNDTVSLAAVNGPSLCVLSGPEEAVGPMESRLIAEGVASKRLETSHAFHSAMMEPVIPPLENLAMAVKRREPAIPILSTVTGRWLGADALEPGYWARHVREPVRFSPAFTALAAEADYVFLECGPGQTLMQLARQHGQRVIMSSLREGGDERNALYTAVAQLWTHGAGVQWEALGAAAGARVMSLPTYPFERKRYFAEAPMQKVEPIPQVVPEPVKIEMPSVVEEVAPPLSPEPLSPEPLSPEPSSSEALSLAPLPPALLPPAFLLRPLLPPPLLPPRAAVTPVTSELTAAPESPAAPEPPAAVVTPAVEPRRERLQREVLALLSSLSGMDLAEADPSLSFIELGFDSLFLTQAAVALHKKFGTKITFRQLLQEIPGPSAVAEHLDRVLPADATTPSVPPPLAPAKPPVPSAPPHKAHGPFRGIDRSASQLTAEQQAHLRDLVARYTGRTAESKRFTAEHRSHLADPRAVAGFRREWKEMIYPLVCGRSEGAKLWDLDNNEYIDITLGFGQILFGHRPPWLVTAMEQQLRRGIEIGPTSPLAGQLAERLARLLQLDRIAFCNTGSEAVAAALRLARTVTGREKVAVFNGAYHGIFDEVLYRPGPMPIAPGIPPSAVQNLVVLDYGTDEALAWLRQNAGELAAVMVEPVQSRHPSLAPREFLQELRRITEGAGTALIFDEIVTGFRVAPAGAQEFFGIRADIATYGKVIGGGMPLGIIGGRREYMDALDGGAWNYGDESFPEVGVTFFAGTFVRHPLMLAAANAVLDQLEKEGPALQRSLAERASALVQRMNGHLTKLAVPLQWETFSSWYHLPLPPELRYAALIFAELRLRGIHAWENRPCFLSAAHTAEDIERIAVAFEESVNELVRAGLLPGNAAQAGGEPEEPAKPIDEKVAAEEEPDDGSFPLTDPQTEILLATQLGSEANAAFNDAIALRIRGPLDPEVFSFALNEVVQRRDALRTTFSAGRLRQTVQPHVPFKLAVEDFTGVAPTELESQIASRARRDSAAPFDLAQGPLFRAALLRTSAEEHVFLLTAHHLVCDGWSFGLVAEELAALYTATCRGMEPDLPPSLTMREYARRQKPLPPAEERWWIDQFATVPAPLDLPTDAPRRPQRTFRAATASIDLPASLCDGLRRAAGARRCTIFSALLGAFYALLHRLSGQRDLVVGIASAGQAVLNETTLVGHCVNFLPMRIILDSAEAFTTLMQRVNALVLDAKERDGITLGRLLQKISVPREAGRIPLASVSFNVDRAPTAVLLNRSPAEFAPLEKSRHGLELSFNLVERQGGFRLYAHYQNELFSPATIERWLGHYATLLGAIATAPATPLGRLALSPAEELAGATESWNATARDYPRDLPLGLLFEIQAVRLPDVVAVQDGATVLTYGQLDAMSNRAAHRLVAAGVQPGSHVAICAGRSAAMIVAMLGVVKAGAAYVPLDPAWPVERLKLLASDAGFAAILVDDATLLGTLPVPPLLLSMLGEPGVSEDSPTVTLDGGDPACVLYTSGSTGVPKGAMIPHRAIARLVLNPDYVSITSDDIVAHASNPAFDATTFEVWGALLNGAQVVVVPREMLLSPEALKKLLHTQGITILFLTTSLFHQLAGHSPSMFGTLSTLIVGGEALRTDVCDEVLKSNGPKRLVNGYGPTEVTTFATWQEVRPGAESGPFIPIGRPIANTTAHVLDEHLELLPAGVEGELYLGGDGVALGYWLRPELTAERFLTRNGERIYRTGDRARRRADGVIEFLGRLDGQLKLRGFRIELGEIEAVLAQHAGLREAAVKVCGDDAARFLAAYLVPKDTAPDAAELRTFLARRLPDYMVPSTFTVLSALPLNANGKLDRAALPEPDAAAPTEGRAPANEMEAEVAGLMASVLKRPSMPMDGDFFLLGGHSLLAMELLSRLRAELGVEISPARLFAASTPEGLAREIAAEFAVIADPDAEPASVPASAPLAEAREAAPAPVPAAPAMPRPAVPAAGGEFQFLVPVQVGEPGQQPLFLVAGGWGGEIEFLVYRQFAQHLDPGQPFWGFKARGAGTYDAPHESVTEMAADYIQEMRAVQPHGPYLLAGECVGGVCAYEMACQLQEAGETVSMLLLLDTSVPSAAELEQYERDEEIKRAAEARGITTHFVRRAGSKVKGLFRRMIGGSATGQPPGADPSQNVAPPQQGQPLYPIVLMQHELRPYPGTVTLVVDDESYSLYGNLGWEHAPAEHIAVLTLPGDHISYIREHVATAAARLRELLAQASLHSEL